MGSEIRPSELINLKDPDNSVTNISSSEGKAIPQGECKPSAIVSNSYSASTFADIAVDKIRSPRRQTFMNFILILLF